MSYACIYGSVLLLNLTSRYLWFFLIFPKASNLWNAIQRNQRHNISEDTWQQVLAFSRCVHENLEGYDPEGIIAWDLLT